jgi:CheY-like chemotaxis protein
MDDILFRRLRSPRVAVQHFRDAAFLSEFRSGCGEFLPQNFQTRLRRAAILATPIQEDNMCPNDANEPETLVLLIAEDDDEVRQFTATVFEEMGVTVFIAANGYEALDVLARHPEIAAVFSDIRMPKMDGVTLAHEALKRCPHLRIALATGYASNIPIDKGFEVIHKPYRIDDLARLLCRFQGCDRARSDKSGHDMKIIQQLRSLIENGDAA